MTATPTPAFAGWTLDDWIAERADFLHVHVVRSVGGSGWDVVLRIDGTYSDRAMAEEVAEMLRTEVRPMVVEAQDRSGSPARRELSWWAGPPWHSKPSPTT